MENTLKLTTDDTLKSVSSRLRSPYSNRYSNNLDYLMRAVLEKFYYHYQHWDWKWGTGERIEGETLTLYAVVSKDGFICGYHEKSFPIDHDNSDAWKQFYKEMVVIGDDSRLFDKMSIQHKLHHLVNEKPTQRLE